MTEQDYEISGRVYGKMVIPTNELRIAIPAYDNVIAFLSARNGCSDTVLALRTEKEQLKSFLQARNERNPK